MTFQLTWVKRMEYTIQCYQIGLKPRWLLLQFINHKWVWFACRYGQDMNLVESVPALTVVIRAVIIHFAFWVLHSYLDGCNIVCSQVLHTIISSNFSTNLKCIFLYPSKLQSYLSCVFEQILHLRGVKVQLFMVVLIIIHLVCLLVLKPILQQPTVIQILQPNSAKSCIKETVSVKG